MAMATHDVLLVCLRQGEATEIDIFLYWIFWYLLAERYATEWLQTAIQIDAENRFRFCDLQPM